MLKYILIFLIGFSATYGFNHKFTNPIDMPNTYVASQNEYYIQVDRDSLVVYKDDIAIYHKSFQNCTQIIKSELDSFRIKRYYDSDKIDNIQFYTKLDLFDYNNRNIAEITISKEKLSIVSDKKIKEIEFSQPKSDKLLDSDVELNIEWSSYFGGSTDDVLLKIVNNSKGDLITGGNTKSSSLNGKYPILAPLGNTDIMLMTMSDEGDLKWLTMIGSGNADYMYGLIVDKDDNIWLTGEARAGNFYIKNAIYNNYGGGTADGVVCKFSKDGDVLFSTYMGGNEYDAITDIAYDKDNDRVWMSGRSMSANFPITSDAEFSFHGKNYSGFLASINSDYTLFYSTHYHDGLGNDYYFNSDFLEIDTKGDIIMAGTTNSTTLKFGSNNNYGLSYKGGFDAFISKFDSNGKLIWSRFVGGTDKDVVSSINIDYSDNILLNIITTSTNIESRGNSTALSNNKSIATDCFLVKLAPDGDLIWSGYFGGNLNEAEHYEDLRIVRSDIIVSPINEIFLTFYTTSTNLKVEEKSIYKNGFGNIDIFLLALDSNSNYLNSTYLGGSGSDTPSGLLYYDDRLYLAGFTSSTDFPIVKKNTKYFGGSNDGFVVCFNKAMIVLTPPEITDFQVAECSDRAEYNIYDSNRKPGYLPVVIYNKENCNIKEVKGFDSKGEFRILTVTVEKIDNSQNAYFKFEVINLADKSIIIDDSLLANVGQFIRIEPNDLADFGEHSIYNGQYCDGIIIYNEGPSDFTIREAYFKDNINFSFPPSQLPFIVPANSSREFNICAFPKGLIDYEVTDTLLIVNPCINLTLPVSIVYNFPELNSDSKCIVPVSIEGNIGDYFTSQSIVSNSNSISIEINKSEDFDITIYNSLSSKIDLLNINKSQNNIDLDFDNLANGVYFIYLNNGEKQKIIRLLLTR